MYDLKNDPNEINNLYGNPAYDKKMKELKRELQKLRTDYEVPEWVYEPPYVSFKGIRNSKN
jgi:hypothetical protein